LLRSADVLLELDSKLADRVLDRPTSAVGQTANRRAGHDTHVVADFFEDLQILQASLTTSQAFRDFQHPAGSLAARRTLAARFMREKTTNVVQDIDNACFFVEDRHGRRAQSETADLSGTSEI